MAITIESVPEEISREDYVRLIRSVGIDPDHCVELTFGVSGITATVLATDENGKRIADRESVAAHHQVYIPVKPARKWATARGELGGED